MFLKIINYKEIATNVRGLAFVAKIEKRKPMTAADKSTKIDVKNCCSAIFVKLELLLMVR